MGWGQWFQKPLIKITPHPDVSVLQKLVFLSKGAGWFLVRGFRNHYKGSDFTATLVRIRKVGQEIVIISDHFILTDFESVSQ